LKRNIGLLKKLIANPPHEDDESFDAEILVASPCAKEEEEDDAADEKSKRPADNGPLEPHFEVNIIGPPLRAPVSTSASLFPVVGSRVEAKLPSVPGTWFFGTVVDVLPGEEFKVTFDDAQKHHKPKDVKHKNLRRIKEKPVNQRDPYAVGAYVWGMFKGHSAAYLRPPTSTNPIWYTGEVQAITADSYENLMYTIKYDDDDSVETLYAVYVRPLLDKEFTL
jgi:hypothetical protein